MDKFLCTSLSIMIFIAGCGGRQPNPISTYMPNDEKRSCDALATEMKHVHDEIENILPKTSKFSSNALCVAGGCLVIVPFFFMNLKEAEKVEFEAYRRRYNHLLVLAVEKDCDLKGMPNEPLPSLKELKKIMKEEKKRQKKEAKRLKKEAKIKKQLEKAYN